jgi:catechol 2,3-dioxygenase-like lactoylglutathione lyase family enzyme
MTVRSFGFALLVATLALGVRAQKIAVSPVGIAHVALRASNVEREIAFLGRLGFEQAFANTDGSKITQAFIKVNDRQFIEVYPISAAGEAPGPLGLMHVCYEAADLEALRDGYTAAGLKVTSWRKASAGNLLFNLQDPDGRVTEFTQYMPGSRQMDDIGQHIGPTRVADELMGFDMPVGNIKASQTFYEAMGFGAERDRLNIDIDLAANPDVEIVLHLARAQDRPKIYLSTDDARRAEQQLRDAGLDATRDKKRVFVSDPDGNEFVLIETAGGHSKHLVPWKKK